MDLGKRRVEQLEGRLWAEARGFLYFETSAQIGTNVVEMFQALFAATVAMVTKGEKPGVCAGSKYTSEQLSLVQRIQNCQDSCEILGVSKTCSRYVWSMCVCVPLCMCGPLCVCAFVYAWSMCVCVPLCTCMCGPCVCVCVE